MYKAGFYMVTVTFIILTFCIFKSGGAFVPRMESLEDRIETLRDRTETFSEQIEIIRTQLEQIKPR